MNKSELISAIAAKADVTKKQAEDIFDATLVTLKEELSAGNDITLPGFGKLEVRSRAARTGRNPQSGEAIQIAASKTVALKPLKALKDAVNS